MTRMVKDAGKFVVICAGYRAEMEEFVNNANPGFRRRFSNFLHIEDYSADQLICIYRSLIRKKGNILTPDAEEMLIKLVDEMVTSKDENFGNAGEMVKLFEKTKARRANRLAQLHAGGQTLTREMYLTIEAEENKFRLSVPCGVCGEEHLAECSADKLLHGRGIGLACPDTKMLCCFIGEDYAVEHEMEQLSLAAAKEREQGDDPAAFADSARERGYGVLIAAAGKAAHLAGALAAHTTLPVIGIPVKSSTLDGLDALLSTVQMPKGIPVATVAIDGADNAAYLAVQMLAIEDAALAQKLSDYKQEMERQILEKNAKLQEEVNAL